ncbi:hypothetical protein KBC99_02915 [Candidatus Saccharibacteria bacterium]|nr:hypothetical protein [Candidatus Saccharibacteria bacterium]
MPPASANQGSSAPDNKPQLDTDSKTAASTSQPGQTPNAAEPGALQSAVLSQLKADEPKKQGTKPPDEPLIDAHGAPLPPKSNKKLILILLAIGLLVFGLIGYFGFSTLIGITKRIAPSPTPSPSPSSTSKVDDALSGVSVVAFESPVTVKDWKTDILAENGITKYISNDSRCQITFAQNKKTESDSTVTTQGSLESYIASVRKQLKTPPTQSAATTYSVQGGGASDRRYEFAGATLRYTGNDNVAYTNQIHARVIGDYQLYIIKACQSPAWDTAQVSLQSVVDATKLIVK